MMKREKAIKNSNRLDHKRYVERLNRWSIVEFRTVYSRLARKDEMIKKWRTIDEIYTKQKREKVVVWKWSLIWRDKKQTYPELLEYYEKRHHKTISRSLARYRYYLWWTIKNSCEIPKKWLEKQK
jgi:hypothetical protein